MVGYVWYMGYRNVVGNVWDIGYRNMEGYCAKWVLIRQLEIFSSAKELIGITTCQLDHIITVAITSGSRMRVALFLSV